MFFMKMVELLSKKYGPLLTINNIAEVFHTTPEGMRQQLARKIGFGVELKAISIKIGRKRFFSAIRVADIIVAAEAAKERGELEKV